MFTIMISASMLAGMIACDKESSFSDVCVYIYVRYVKSASVHGRTIATGHWQVNRKKRMVRLS